ncbi:MAG: MBL fold metallo-hydrolase [Nannocystaceae bacterium]|nr:MBL fold metallo-hydrolase [Myxococcales bacterium]
MQAARPLADGITLLPLHTPTLPPATATNTLVIGRRRVVVIEPATPYPDERRKLDAVIDARLAAGGELVAILLTHHHADHVGYARDLAERTGAPVCAHPETAARLALPVDRTLADGEVIELDEELTVTALFTPGHAPGHLVYLERRTGIAHAGDMVAGVGTILIDPEDGGDMIAYLASLERLGACGASALVPAHGPVIDAPAACVRQYVDHRLARERRVLAALDGGPRPFEDVLARAYGDTPPSLWPLAARSLRAHLDKLEREGVVRSVEHKLERAD